MPRARVSFFILLVWLGVYFLPFSLGKARVCYWAILFKEMSNFADSCRETQLLKVKVKLRFSAPSAGIAEIEQT